jgi:hypothetical protein
MPAVTTRRPDLRTVEQFCAEFPAFPLASMRWLLFHRRENGLEHAVLKLGHRRLLIDVDKFFEWIQSRGQTEAMPEQTVTGEGHV